MECTKIAEIQQAKAKGFENALSLGSAELNLSLYHIHVSAIAVLIISTPTYSAGESNILHTIQVLKRKTFGHVEFNIT